MPYTLVICVDRGASLMTEGITDTIDVDKDARRAWSLAAQHFAKPVHNRSDTEMSLILSLISKLSPFAPLPFELRLAIAKSLKYRALAPAEVLLSLVDQTPVVPGEYTGQCFYVVVSGCIQHSFMSTNGRMSRDLYRDETIGSPAVVLSLPVTSRYTASEATQVVYLELEQYHAHVDFMDAQVLAARQDFFRNALLVPILSSWNDEQIRALSTSVFPWRFPSRSVAVKEGDMSDFMFFILQGKMKVVREINFTAANGEPCAKLLELATLTRGEYFGELGFLRMNIDESRLKLSRRKEWLSTAQDFSFAPEDCVSEGDDSDTDVQQLNPLLEPIPRQATVYAQTPTDVLLLPRDIFLRLFQGNTLVRLIEYAKGYPSQTEIQNHYHKQEKWASFKDHVISQAIVGAVSSMPLPKKGLR